MTDVIYDTPLVVSLSTLELGTWGDLHPGISAATIAELSSAEEPRDALERSRRGQRLTAIRSAYRVIPFGAAEGEALGLLAALSRQRARPSQLPTLCLQIAATAMVLDVPLLTLDGETYAGLERAVEVVVV